MRGGNINNQLVNVCLSKFANKHKIELARIVSNVHVVNRLRNEYEKAKERLFDKQLNPTDINASPIAGAFFTERDLIFICMNDNHAFPHLCAHIRSEADNLQITEQ